MQAYVPSAEVTDLYRFVQSRDLTDLCSTKEQEAEARDQVALAVEHTLHEQALWQAFTKQRIPFVSSMQELDPRFAEGIRLRLPAARERTYSVWEQVLATDMVERAPFAYAFGEVLAREDGLLLEERIPDEKLIIYREYMEGSPMVEQYCERPSFLMRPDGASACNYRSGSVRSR